MPPKRRPISVEWAKSLVGLSMKVPDYWWDGCKGYKLNDGVIDSYCEISQRWNLLLDTKEDDALYLMAYEAIYKYADFDSSTYNEFQLTQQPIRDGDDEIQTETKKYFRTEPDEWDEVVIEDGDSGGRPIEPLEWEGDEEFTVKITDEELDSLRDERRKLRDPVTHRRNKDFTDVNCPEQQWVYCQTYHLIDKGNGSEAKYDLSTESHLHGWSPKLASRFFNMNLNNAYNIYKYLYTKYHPDRTPMIMRSCINDLTHSLLQQGSEIRTRGFGDAPSATKDITTTSSSLDGRKLRSDAFRQHFTSPTTVHTATSQTPVSDLGARALRYRKAASKLQKERQPGRNHISVPVVVKKNTATSYCKYHKCPGKNTGAKRKRAYMSKYACEDCSLEKGADFFLCNSTKSVGGNLVVVDCHTAYHVEKKLYTAPSPFLVELVEKIILLTEVTGSSRSSAN
ncbi:hypothetical protein FRACYDRAFT_256571 [Fragilariopsis cylindrus CCMP1102]|uniref:Uncharacterized protein n=1 Tax=Fragilariopsis cylindrus CCMP1102 TaxID=635003 RepID=A0A1E7EJH9_9STRA|nr:hypothetical protein FRACYDRAFT_256571 [Fragilariopsis cylindrus CCMP1102]|eukprot:OEU06056.1 hypothetical protein FRACYDRAFT_256571 [Fragilariopsis cylindrus CCMP1102]